MGEAMLWSAPKPRPPAPMPERPTFYDDGGNAHGFDDLEALALHIHAKRRGRAIQLRYAPRLMRSDELVEFAGYQLWVTPKGGNPDWAGTIWLAGQEFGELETQLKATRERAAAERKAA